MFVVGVETDFQGTSIGSGAGGNSYAWLFGIPTVTTATLNWFGTVRGRVGVNLLSPQLLVYGTGEFAYGEVKRNGWLNQNSTVQTGWTAGGGADMFVALPNWSVKAEYLYTQLSGNNNNGFNFGLNLNDVNNRTRFHTIRFGVNYHFNFSSSAPVPRNTDRSFENQMHPGKPSLAAGLFSCSARKIRRAGRGPVGRRRLGQARSSTIFSLFVGLPDVGAQASKSLLQGASGL